MFLSRYDFFRGRSRGRKRAPAALMAAFALVFFLTLIISCDELPDPGGNIPEGGPKPVSGDTSRQYAAFVSTTDYTLTGGFGVIDLDNLALYSPDPAWAADVVSPDSVVTSGGDYIFVINRYTYDSISVLNKSFSLVKQYSVREPSCDPSNPHDLAYVSDDKAYLTLYECSQMWIINPVTGDKLGSINLSSYGGGDGVPEMSGMLLHGSTLYVAVQMLNRNAGLSPPDHSRLVMIDTGTDTVAGDIELAGSNPVTDVMYSDSLGVILVGSVGNYFVTGDNGGIEAVSPAAAASLGFIINEAAINGNLGDFEILSQTRGYATVTTDDFRSELIAFNPATGVRETGTIYSSAEGFALWDIALTDQGLLLVCDRSATAPGVAVIDTQDNDRLLTGSAIYLGLPPSSIALLR